MNDEQSIKLKFKFRHLGHCFSDGPETMSKLIYFRKLIKKKKL
jgi:hypothetical protein